MKANPAKARLWTAMLLGLLAGSAATLPAAGARAADPAHGQTVFREQCGLCHTAGPGDGDGGQGPDLVGVVGRKAASGDFPYTAALKGSGLTWTPEALDRFLTDPAKVVPGTAMPVSVANPKDRQDLIAYLASLKGH